jgi:hypothetical protein
LVGKAHLLKREQIFVKNRNQFKKKIFSYFVVEFGFLFLGQDINRISKKKRERRAKEIIKYEKIV